MPASSASIQTLGRLAFTGTLRLLRLLFGCSIVAGIATVPAGAQAQDADPVADTLDWRGYVPLAVGNVWQYANHAHMSPFGTTDEWVETWDITADTTIASEVYFAVEVTCDSIYTYPELGSNPCRGSSTKRHFVRYDDDARNIVTWKTDEATTPRQDLWFRYDFRLDAAFNSKGTSEQVFEYGYSRDERPWVLVSGDTVRTTVKWVEVFSAVPGSLTFAHRVGLIHKAFSEEGGSEHELVFARIGEQVYGSRMEVGTAAKPVQATAERLDVYPNPARDDYTVHFDLSHPGVVWLVMYDLLGRVRAAHEAGYRSAGTHTMEVNAGGLASGHYQLVLRASGRTVGSRAVVIVR